MRPTLVMFASILAAALLAAAGCAPKDETAGKAAQEAEKQGAQTPAAEGQPAQDAPAQQPPAATPDKPAGGDKTPETPPAAGADKPAEGEKTPEAPPAAAAPDKPAEGDEEGEGVQLDLARASGPVSIEVLPQFTLLEAGNETELNVLVRLKAAKAEERKRPPLDLAIVLDRSGSMRGDKLANVKKAAIELVDKLDRTDRVTLVTYSTDVDMEQERVPMDEPGRDALKKRLAKIRATDRTALGPALFTALDILEKAEREETDLAHVLLLSDGLANVGETRPDVLAARTASAFAKGVSVSSLGVGLDYAEDLMTRIADQGGGRYHFIKGPEQIAGVLNDEFSGLASTVARGIFLTFRPTDGATLSRVFGYPLEDVDGLSKVKVGGLYGGQTREILLRFKVTAPKVPAAALGSLFVTFRDVTKEGAEAEEEMKLGLAVTEDAEAVKKSEKTEVTIRVAEVESAEVLDQAARAVDRGDYDAARHVMSLSIGRLREQSKATPSARLDDQIMRLEGAVGGVGAAAESEEKRREYIKEKKAGAYDLMK